MSHLINIRIVLILLQMSQLIANGIEFIDEASSQGLVFNHDHGGTGDMDIIHLSMIILCLL